MITPVGNSIPRCGTHEERLAMSTEGIEPNLIYWELDTGEFYYFGESGWAKVGGASESV